MKKVFKICLVILILITLIVGGYFLTKYCLEVNKKINEPKEDDTVYYFDLKPLTITKDETYELNDFIEFCKINNDTCTYRYENENMASLKEIGTYEIKIIANDKYTETTTLTITNNNSKQDLPAQNQSTTPPKENSSEKKIKTDTKEEITEKVNTKYGTRIITKTTSIYDIYNDNTEEKVSEKQEVYYDYSTFNATLSELNTDATIAARLTNENTKELIEVFNAVRKAYTLPTLTYSEEINKIAYIRSIEALWSNNLNTTRPNNQTLKEIFDYYNINASNMQEYIYTFKKDEDPSNIDTAKLEDDLLNVNLSHISIGMFVKDDIACIDIIIYQGE